MVGSSRLFIWLVLNLYLKPKVKDEATKQPGITIVTFAFRHGRVENADITIDVRNIISSDSIYYGETGKEPRIINLIRGYEALIAGLEETIKAAYEYNRHSPLLVSIGCTHGRHRSVGLAEILKERMSDLPINVIHRDLR